MDARAYSQARIDSTWTQADHDWLVNHLDQIDQLTQALYNLRRMAPAAERMKELVAA
jgi:hypothetical protein